MRILLLGLVVVLPFLSFSQFFGFSASYHYDQPFGNAWKDEHGLKFGFGAESKLMETLPLSLSVRYTGAASWVTNKQRVDDILFDLPEEISNPYGFANIDYAKYKFGIEVDLGYLEDEYDYLEPYVTFGPHFENYVSRIDYDLYEVDTCHCFSSPKHTLTQTMSLGFNSGLGLKIRPAEVFFFDLRFNYYGGWTLSHPKSSIMPMTETFYIDNLGVAAYESSNKIYNHGYSISLGIIVSLEGLLSNIGSGSRSRWSDDDDDDSSSDDDTTYENASEESSGSSSGGGGSTCTPITLTPAGTRSGPPD